MGSFLEINLSLGLSATVDKSTRGNLLRDQSLFGTLTYFDKSTRGNFLRDQSLFGPLSYC